MSQVGSTPMHYAAGSNSVDCIRLLAAHGAQIDAMNTEVWALSERHQAGLVQIIL